MSGQFAEPYRRRKQHSRQDKVPDRCDCGAAPESRLRACWDRFVISPRSRFVSIQTTSSCPAASGREPRPVRCWWGEIDVCKERIVGASAATTSGSPEALRPSRSPRRTVHHKIYGSRRYSLEAPPLVRRVRSRRPYRDPRGLRVVAVLRLRFVKHSLGVGDGKADHLVVAVGAQRFGALHRVVFSVQITPFAAFRSVKFFAVAPVMLMSRFDLVQPACSIMA